MLTFNHIKPVRVIDDVGDFDTKHGGVHVFRQKLDVGDYGCIIRGVELPCYIERKSKADLWGTMTSGYKRFKKEMERAEGKKFILAIEENYGEIAKGFSYSRYSGDAMRKKLATLYVRYDLITWFCRDRREMSMRIFDLFESLGKNYVS